MFLAWPEPPPLPFSEVRPWILMDSEVFICCDTLMTAEATEGTDSVDL